MSTQPAYPAPASASPSPLLPLPTSPPTADRADDHHAHFLDAATAIAAAGLLNKHNVQANSAIELCSPAPSTPRLTSTGSTSAETSTRTSTASSTPRLSTGHVQFRSHTIAPSPPPLPPSHLSTSPTSLQTPSHGSRDTANQHLGSPLLLHNDLQPATPVLSDPPNGFTTPSRSLNRPSLTLQHKTSASSLKPISRTPSLKTGSLASVLGTASAASSTYPSPVISAMGDVTPLPSPLLSCDSPGPWKKLGGRPSRDAPAFHPPHPGDNGHSMSTGEPLAPATPTQPRRKGYAGLALALALQVDGPGAGPKQSDGDRKQGMHTHSRNRSISDYVPDPMVVPKRMVTVSGSHVKPDGKSAEPGFESHMRREPHLSEARGLTPIEKPPTPPPSESSLSANEASSVADSGSSVRSSSKPSRYEYFEAYGRHDRKRRRWRSLRMLGQGTFSRVMLATSQVTSETDEEDYQSGLQTPEPLPRYDRRTLVAVKVCEHGPRGGASEDRIEMSLKRELSIMQSLHHPSLIHLKAWNIEDTRAILVLSYCAGGDLFDVASGHRELLSPGLLRRIFAEIVGAVRYLHAEKIVHRDIKLENVLVNLPPSELSSTTDWTTYPHSVITLTDLGLSRRIADDEKLETRCGSDDYAAPEVIMGQPYDGRATDAWSLGVLLYALLESRLPFDPHPAVGDHAMQMRMRSRTSHRIARVEWRWIEYGVHDGEGEGEGDHEADVARFAERGLLGAMEVVEALLKRARSRWPLAKVAETEWVGGGIQVEGDIKFREEEEGEEVP
ncbi:kinase-like domain-containing protein [Lasiosphaeris hirsuta]|uniref:Kinase-like domain-containing protein n=1 Tax=Lasiosphaeris hirsuta TaxID=260670 RepID=A0AA40AQ06_9PEZI|nr:kinase-like domain-containing protein [Lasiosphaeris hirsuta]